MHTAPLYETAAARRAGCRDITPVAAGFRRVMNLVDGMLAYRAAGF